MRDFLEFLKSCDLDLHRGIGVESAESVEFLRDDLLLDLLPNESRAMLLRRGETTGSGASFRSHSSCSGVEPVRISEGNEMLKQHSRMLF